MRFRRKLLWGLFGIGGLLILGWVFSFLSAFDPVPYLQVVASGEIRDRHGALLFVYLSSEEQWCFERDLPEISPHLIQATLAVEDSRFYTHFGVDPLAVLRACWQNARAGKVISGASTISMQVVKRVQGNTRGIQQKMAQAIDAIRLEWHVDKNTILRTYLNTAPYGLNLVGCEAASRRYFGKAARELTLPEAALLAGLPKAPTSYNPLKNPDLAKRRRDHVLLRMKTEGFIDEAAYQAAVQAPVGAKRHEFPALAHHFAARIQAIAAAGKKVNTTLDAGQQRLVEQLLRETIRGYAGKIGNAAAIVVDVESACVLAWAGSADFFSTPGGGQVDVCRARRSPGSTLKPFLYAAAIDRHVLYSSEMLLDGTLDYGLYAPENADGRYRGLVSAGEALRRSLNVPAVVVLERLGVEAIYDFLRQMGFRSFRKGAGYYGLGFALGDCEVTLEELVAAYAMLAALGRYRPPRILADAPVSESKEVLTQGTCLQVYEMLEQPLPEELSLETVHASGYLSRVCWKTGTSTGQRDAWAVVFNTQYVVGVWMGNNDGRPSPWLVGARAALPLAAKIFRGLPVKSSPAWPETSERRVPVAICAVSGLPATTWCERRREILFPRDQFLNRKCDVHYPVQEADGTFRVVERWPGSAKGWDLAHVETSSDWVREKQALARVSATRILEPVHHAEFVLTGEPQGDRIRLRASTDLETTLHWYLNDRYLGTSTAEKPLYLSLVEGEHRLTCMDTRGDVDSAEFTVVPPQGTVEFKTR